ARWAAGAAAGTRPAGTTARLTRPSGACHRCLAGKKAFALGLLARQLAGPAHGLGLLAYALLGRLLVVFPLLHLAEDALALHLPLQRPESLIDVIVANLDQQTSVPSCALLQLWWL